MIQYNQLSIEGKLHIDIEVEDKPYFDNIFISGVRIDTADTYNTEHSFKTIEQEDSKELVVNISIAGTDDLFIITPIVSGYPSEDAPCGQDEVNPAYIYCDAKIRNRGLSYLKELGEDCTIPKGFVDFILLSEALDLALQTCNYSEAVKYWNFLHRRSIRTSNKCGCHGLK